ncbi:hypothetical protein R84981_003019 [Carnimonas sp. R-84981]|uniref:zinc-ribbon domain-containing protein n=1 Tax=Carnimonas bestiolae TaxID=3402172 RepID=UPI003EDC3F90
MALVKCWECGAKISDSAQQCPKCGASQDESAEKAEAQKKNNGGCLGPIILVVVIFIALFIVAAINGSGPPSQKSIDRDAIDSCWETQGRKDLSPATQRFEAGVCYKMEDDFKAKYDVSP